MVCQRAKTIMRRTKRSLVKAVSVAELVEELEKMRSATEPGRTLVRESLDVMRDGKIVARVQVYE